MKHKIFLLTFSLFVILFLGCFEQIFACWCRSVTSCEATNRASTVFVGEVQKIIPDSNPENDYSYRRTIILKVKESFTGKKSKTIKIKTGTDFGPGDCNYYSFEQDKTYLVYAYINEEKILSVGECGGTKKIEKADDDLKYLRNLSDGNENGTITGSVFGPSFDSILNEYSDNSLTGIPLMLSGNGVNKTISTNESGEYEFNNLKAGKYRLEVFLPDFYSLAKYGDDAVSEVFSNGKGCSKNSFFPEVKNSLEGKVFDTNEKPLKNIEVYLFPEIKSEENKEYNYSETTDENGNYKFDFIFPGRYILGIKTDEKRDEDAPDLFYPNTQIRSEAAIIDFGLGQTLNNYDVIWQNKQ